MQCLTHLCEHFSLRACALCERRLPSWRHDRLRQETSYLTMGKRQEKPLLDQRPIDACRQGNPSGKQQVSGQVLSAQLAEIGNLSACTFQDLSARVPSKPLI